MSNTLPMVPGEGSRTQWTGIVGGILNVLAILVETFLGIDIPGDVWMAANTVIIGLLGIFLGDKVNRTEEAANQAVAASPKKEPVA